MKILIMGTGGVGGYYGGLLAQQGNDVIFIARGQHLEATRREGLQIKSIHGDFKILPAQAAEEPSQAGPVDLVLFSVKTYNTDQAAEALHPAVGPQTAVLSLQNGIDAAERIGRLIGMEHMKLVQEVDQLRGRPGAAIRVGCTPAAGRWVRAW